jgi:arylsulfatase A-like enzyme
MWQEAPQDDSGRNPFVWLSSDRPGETYTGLPILPGSRVVKSMPRVTRASCALGTSVPRSHAEKNHASTHSSAAAPSPLEASVTVLLAAIVVDALLWLFLYLRPSPLGAPFALDPSHYVFHALIYGAWGQVITALPFLLRGQRCPTRPHGGALALQTLATAILLLLGALDREFQRFLGMHLSVSWLGTYGAVSRTPDVVWDALARDHGGAWSSVIGLGLPLLYAVLAPLLALRVRYDTFGRRHARTTLAMMLVAPTIVWNVPGGKLRQAKVRPALLVAAHELLAKAPEPQDPARLKRSIATYQAHYGGLSSEPRWRFFDPEYPLRKRYVGPVRMQPSVRPNFIVLSLETFRAKDMKSMNPALEGPAPTPFLDALAQDSGSSYWTRYYASGVPTVYAFMSIHASLIMHPTRSIPYDATADHIDGFPAALRAHGYRTLHFTGSDPDWDSQRVWLNRWYDEVDYSPADRERDRLTFRRAAGRIREVARRDQPFLAYISSISNHTPFRSPEPELALHGGATTRDALHDTMRYTDDVVRELYTSLASEPWFANTIWIITGDHGFDLGDRGESGGHENLRHETTWVPLIVHNAGPQLARGEQACVGSHLDIAPTVMELASIWDDNSYMGQSLLNEDCARADALIVRGTNYAYETAAYSFFRPAEGASLAYAGDDRSQEHALRVVPAALQTRADQLHEAFVDTIRFVIDEDRVVRKPVGMPHRDVWAMRPSGSK